MTAANTSNVLIYGGKGALGCILVKHFKSKGHFVISIDLFENSDANKNIIITQTNDWVAQETEVLKLIGEIINEHGKLDAICCVAGGWAGGNAASPEMIKNADLMIKQSVWSSGISARIASLHLKEGRTLQLTGAQPARTGTSFMMGYGMAKAAVHQFVASLSSGDTGLPEGTTTFALLPVTLDTPGNRQNMPNADFSTWTPLEFIAEYLENVISGTDRPANGALLEVVTVGGVTKITSVN